MAKDFSSVGSETLILDVCMHTVGYARMNVIGSRTSFVIASVLSSIH
jgi:hypothetical protein